MPNAKGSFKEIIAVLPFINATSAPNAEYLSDGITEGLIHTLSRVPQLRVMARVTVFHYKGQQADPSGVICGRTTCRNPGFAWLTLDEEKQYRDKGERIFSMDTASAKIVIQYQLAGALAKQIRLTP